MPCTKQTTKKYQQRNAPPYPGNQCREGERKLGNDGQWYVVSKPNVNGVKRWIKVAGNRIKTAPRRRAPGQRRSPSRAPRRAPRRAPSPVAILENVPWRMFSRSDNAELYTQVYLTKPRGNFVLYEVVDQQFVELTDYGDHFVGNRIRIADTKRLIRRGYKVWVVSSSPIPYDT